MAKEQSMNEPDYFLIIKQHSDIYVGLIVLDGVVGSDSTIYKFVHKDINKVKSNLSKELFKLKQKSQ